MVSERLDFLFGLVEVDGVGEPRRDRLTLDKPLGMRSESSIESRLPPRDHGFMFPRVNDGRGKHRDSAVPMLVIVPLEEATTPGFCVVIPGKTVWVVDVILRCLVHRLGKRIVVADAWTAVGTADLELIGQLDDLLRFLGGTAVRMHRELSRLNLLV